MLKGEYFSDASAMELPTQKNLIDQIEADRKAADISQERLAELVGLRQDQIARLLSGESDRLQYNDAEKITEVLAGFLSLVPAHITALEIASKTVESETLDKTLVDVCEKMIEHGFSQIPIYDDSNKLVGAFTEDSLRRYLLSPPKVRDEHKNRVKIDIHKLTLRDLEKAGALDEIPEIEGDESLRLLAAKLEHHYAIILVDITGKTRGIVTRADLLKLAVEDL